MKMTECFHGLTFSLDTDQVGSFKECTAENKGIFFFFTIIFFFVICRTNKATVTDIYKF